MSKAYEMTLILDSQLSEEGVEESIKRYQDYLTGQGAQMVDVVRWGVRKLAYEIAKRQQGVYCFIRFLAEPRAVSDLDRMCRMDELVLRYMVVIVEGGLELPQSSESDAEAEVASGTASEVDEEAEGVEGVGSG